MGTVLNNNYMKLKNNDIKNKEWIMPIFFNLILRTSLTVTHLFFLVEFLDFLRIFGQ